METIKNYLNSYNGEVAQRLFIAIVIGYILANAYAIILSYFLPLPINDSVRLAEMLSYLFYTIVIMWVFAKKKLSHVWRASLISLLISGLIIATRYYLKMNEL